MKVVQINATCGAGSTGKICVAVSHLLTESGSENYVLYCGEQSDYSMGVRYASYGYIKLQALKSRILGNYGFNSKLATRRLIRHLKQISPDVVHIHNIHGHNCDLRMLLSYLKKERIKVFWTFHDCWAFTGYCTHFDRIGCDKWKTGCHNCPESRHYSWFRDRSAWLQEEKKRLLQDLDLSVITPSRWLAGLVMQSFLKDKEVQVIHNGIDLEVFRPCESNIRERYQIGDKHIVLGVSFGWDEKKGLDVFCDLAKRLDESYAVVLVGTDAAVDQILPPNVISIHRTQNQQELAQLYSAADVFVNPTREDNYPTVNMEALACGTPVVTFATGGSPEMLDETCGAVVQKNDVDAMEREIRRVRGQKPYTADACCRKARSFDQNSCFAAYLSLYKELCHE